MADIAASVLARLKNKAAESGRRQRAYDFSNIWLDTGKCALYECQLESEPRARLILSHLCSFEKCKLA